MIYQYVFASNTLYHRALMPTSVNTSLAKSPLSFSGEKPNF